MNENLSPTGKILDILGDLELPLLKPVRENEDGYEIMLSLPEKRKISRETLKQVLETKGLKVISLDVFREKSHHYAWTLLNPEKTEAEVG